VKRFLMGFVFAWNGLRQAILMERNLKVHLGICCTIVVAGCLVELSDTEWAIVFLTMGVVLGFELLNTALEQLVDFVSPNKHPKAGLIKDIAAGSVLIVAITAFIIGLLIFLPKLFNL
jgi:diacylglycerol kinase